MSFADWNVVTISKNQKPTFKQVSKTSFNEQKINKDEIPVLKTLGIEAGKQIQQARLNLNLSQSVLATKINVLASVIKSYENGTAVPNREILNKLNKTLNIKIVFSAKN